MQPTASTIHRHILNAKKIMIVPHQNPDGDAVGAATAFLEYVTSLGKPAIIFCVTPANDKLHFIPHSTEIVSDHIHFKDLEIDTIVVLDSGDLRYNGIADLVKDHPATIINIDHHNTNQRYGHINLVLPTAASTTEILFHYFRHNSIHINNKMATSLLTGLATDTGNFSNAATSSSALQAGGELIRSGGNFNLINTNVSKSKTIDSLRLWGKVFSRLQKDERTGITHTYMTQADLIENNANESESEGIANFLSNLENNKIALMLKETVDGKIKGSFRTTRDDTDVSAMAKKLGGGGHKKAAGFTIEGTIESALAQILAM
jgi:phosphoesterase RecJ-like protein